MKAPKFKVGDVLMPVIEVTDLVKLHVIEVIMQTCAARIEQITYKCRVYTIPYREFPAHFTKDLFTFNEIEVELWKEKPKGEM